MAKEELYDERNASIYDLENAGKTDDVAFWSALAREHAGGGRAALELGCGTLRLTVPVARAGVRVLGLDASPAMLKRGRARLAELEPEVSARITIVEGDLRFFQVEERFGFIYLPFNTYSFLRTAADQAALFASARAHLAPEGVFALEVPMLDMPRLFAAMGMPFWQPYSDFVDPVTKRRFQRDWTRALNPLQQEIAIKFRTKQYLDDELEREWISAVTMSYTSPRELQHIVARAGLQIVDRWGNYERRRFEELTDPRIQILVLRAS